MDIVTAQEMYEWDRVAIEETGIKGVMLMENAGRAIADRIAPHLKAHAVVLIGSGHNGGDGFVLARTLLDRGYDIDVWQVVPDEKISGDAAVHKRIFSAAGYDLRQAQTVEDLLPSLKNADVIIDAILGIGVKGQLRDPIASIVEAANEQPSVRIAVDIPTGVPAGESAEEFYGFQADYTVMVAAPKMSAFLQRMRPFYGEWEVADIGLPVLRLPSPKRKVWSMDDVSRTLPVRHEDSHKGSHGKGLMIGGSLRMPGSIAMSARAALRSGAGLLTIGTVQEAFSSIAPFVQEAMFSPIEAENGFAVGQAPGDLSSYDGVAIGMGLGRGDKTSGFFKEVLRKTQTPLLIDADGLYLLAHHLNDLKMRQGPTILTPHPGEFAHLLGLSIQEVLTHPFSLSRKWASEHGVYIVLKGPATVITAPDGEQRVDTSGNAGLAKGGSGDVLSGILLAMLMQSDSILDALSNGCVIHGTTAEELTENDHSMRDLMATDVIEGLSRTFRTCSF